ncbi:MAG: UbiA family prenyltransferase [Clostridia bacterium]|nr:UbiA family prenyltransferase [Clostridia bacterium]
MGSLEARGGGSPSAWGERLLARAALKARALWDTTVPLHAVFGLTTTIAASVVAVSGWPSGAQLAWIVVALVFGRAAGFGLNRVIDAQLDAKNPRTRNRPIPTGRLTRAETLAFSLACLAVLALAAWELNPLTLYFFPLAVAGLVVYPYGKYHTWACHYWQVWPQFCGPFGAWLALRGDFAPAGVAFALGYALWVAASDMLFHAGDRSFQRAAGVHSAPADLGLARALRLAGATHAAALSLIALAGLLLGLAPGYFLVLSLCLPLVANQYRLVLPPRGAGAGASGGRAEPAVPIERAMLAFNTNAVAGPLLLLAAVLGVAA